MELLEGKEKGREMKLGRKFLESSIFFLWFCLEKKRKVRRKITTPCLIVKERGKRNTICLERKRGK